MKYMSTRNDSNIEGTVWYMGLQCPPDSKSTVPPCTLVVILIINSQ